MPSIYSPRMQDHIQKQILDAFFIVLRPIAKILLRFGIGYREFAEVTKSAFVDVATSEYGIRGRPTNISRVAVMTGLTRKEVRRLRDKLEADEQTVVARTTPMWEVLHYWHADEEFLDSSGRPSELPFQGESGSFSNLVRRFGGDIPPGAMRAELKRVGAIEEVDGGLLRVVKRSFRPEGNQETLVNSLLHSVYALLNTVAHNTNPDRLGDTFAQRMAYSQKVNAKDIVRLRRVSFDRIEEFTQAIDDTFMAYETITDDSTSQVNDDCSTVAVGVYYFEEKNTKLKHGW